MMEAEVDKSTIFLVREIDSATHFSSSPASEWKLLSIYYLLFDDVK